MIVSFLDSVGSQGFYKEIGRWKDYGISLFSRRVSTVLRRRRSDLVGKSRRRRVGTQGGRGRGEDIVLFYPPLPKNKCLEIFHHPHHLIHFRSFRLSFFAASRPDSIRRFAPTEFIIETPPRRKGIPFFPLWY